MDKSINKIFNNILKYFEKILNFKKFDLIIISLIIIISFILRMLWLNQFPPNITGDEAEDLSSVYQILFDKNIHLFTFFGDGSIPSIIFYPVILFIKIFGINNSLFSLRLYISILSVISLIPFFLLLKKYTKSTGISALFTFALSCNYVYLNFSRTAWINMTVIFTGLFLLLFLEKALEKNTKLSYGLSGFFAGLSLYGYHYGKVLILSVSCFLLLRFFVKKNRNYNYFKNIALFFTTALLVSLPLIISIYSDNPNSIFTRPKAVFAFSNDSLNSKSAQTILEHQLEYVFKGFILLDGNIMSDGIENMRYIPFLTPPVNFIMKMLFIVSFIYFLMFNRKNYLLWIIFLTTVITQVLSALPPNYSRGLFYIPFIYIISAIFINKMLQIPTFKTKKKFIYSFLLISVIFMSITDLNLYFKWMNSSELKNARFPYLEYSELKLWQSIQITRIKSGFGPIKTYQEWEIIKNE